ncbi:hypothetical protein AB9F29_13785 [Falsihalocynthiibacter sp. S25ZX9]|uniref:hypothetical protein n=1 Tax=Falsihalocynthiibacter sp. S25ZX9 TaxID=3240870 RepID=UPI00350F5C98
MAEAQISYEQIERSKKEPYFPFGIEKICGDAYPRLRLADVKGSPQQGNISLWETRSKSANIDRYVLWHEKRACGFLIETPADDGEGSFAYGDYIVLYDRTSGADFALRKITVEGMEFGGALPGSFTDRDKEIFSNTYQEKFLECRAQTDGSKDACRDATQDWVDNNTATLAIAFYDQEEAKAYPGVKINDSVGFFMIEDRLWWAGREIK